MIEVFKTDITDVHSAKTTVKALHHEFPMHKANFDLEDRDRILRVESKNGALKVPELLQFLYAMGVRAEVLPD